MRAPKERRTPRLRGSSKLVMLATDEPEGDRH
jgi:hypothetical protein